MFSNWKEKYEELKEAGKFIRENQGIMTPLEARVTGRTYSEKKQKYYQAIFEGVDQEFREALDTYIHADQKAKEARLREERRFDPIRVSQYRQAIKSELDEIRSAPGLLTGGNVAERMRELYEEVSRSGNIEYQYAGYRLIGSAALGLTAGGALDRDTRLELNRIFHRSLKDAEELRSTPELETALSLADQARKDLVMKRLEFLEVGQYMDDFSPENPLNTSGYAREFRRVKFFKDGHMEVYGDDSPEVTGVLLPEQGLGPESDR